MPMMPGMMAEQTDEMRDPLMAQLNAQWQAIQRTMQDMHNKQREQSASTSKAQSQALQVANTAQRQNQLLLDSLAQHQQTFMQSMERAFGLVEALVRQHGPSTELVEVVRGMKSQLAELPEQLGDRLSQTLKRQRATPSTVATAPVTVTMPSALTKRLDSLEEALVKGLRQRPQAPTTDPRLLDALKRSRSRTFGSNY